MLEGLKRKAVEKAEAEKEREAKRIEREQKKIREEKRLEKECKKEEKQLVNTTCPKCGIRYGGDSLEKWICCDRCGMWFNKTCTNIKRRVPKVFLLRNVLHRY